MKFSFRNSLIIIIIIEGFHAKRAYIAFRVDFIFAGSRAIFGRLTCFDIKSIVA